MNAPRVNLWKLSVFVALVAVNLAAGRALYAYTYSTSDIAPMVLALQVAAYRLFRVRGPATAFWTGFMACGLAVLASFIWAGEYWVHGTWIDDPASQANARAWGLYFRPVNLFIDGVGLDPKVFAPGNELYRNLLFACTSAPPQFLIAISGGLAARTVARWRGRRHGRPPTGQLP
jgi:hypothetical protein